MCAVNPVRFLIVDDDRGILNHLEKYLSKPNIEITLAENGEEAFCKIQEFFKEKKYFSLIVSDVNMPKMDGYELIKKITNTYHDYPALLVLMSSAPGEIYDHDESQFVQAILNKPFNILALKDIVDSVNVMELQSSVH